MQTTLLSQNPDQFSTFKPCLLCSGEDKKKNSDITILAAYFSRQVLDGEGEFVLVLLNNNFFRGN